MTIRSLLPASLAVVLITAHASGQTAAPVAQNQPLGVPAQSTSQTQVGADLNQAIAGCLLLGNQEEVALAEFAQSRAQTPQVKQFAQMLIEDHEKAVEKLTQIAPELAQKAFELRGQQTASQNGAPGQPQAAVGQTSSLASSNGVFALQQRIAQECLALTQKELGQKQGVEFDECYIGSQVGAHIGMLAKLRGSKHFATGELKQTIQDCEQTVQKHLDHAKQLAVSLKGGNASRQTSQRPGEPDQPVRQ